MKSKWKKRMQHVIVFVLIVGMLLPLANPISAQAAEKLYLAYQNTETGNSVAKLKGASAKGNYKVTELNMSKGDSVDLCFINAAFLWHNAKWTSDNEKVATVNSAGVITAVGEGVAKVTLTYDIRFSKEKESASVTVYVGEDNWKLHIGTTAKDISESRELKVGRKLDLAFFGVSDWNGGKLFNYEWMSSDETILSVDKFTGVITALKPGTVKVGIHLFNKVTNITINDIIEVKVLPTVFSDSAWQNENYRTYGENYLRLFSSDYMFRIPGSVLDKHVLNEYGRIAETPSGGAMTESYYAAITKLDSSDKFWMGAFEFLQNGTNITVNAAAGGSDTYEEAKMYACILRFVEELQKNRNSISSIVFDAAETTDTFNSIYTEGVDLSKSELIEVLEDSKYLTELEIKEMVDELYRNCDLISDLISEGTTIAEYIGSAIRLHEVDEAVLDLLSKCTSNGSSLSNALNVLLKEKSKSGVAVCAEKYLSEKAADIINEIINVGTGGKAEVIIQKVGEVEEVLHLDMDSYYAAVEFGCYQTDLRFYCKDLLKEINTNFNSYTREELKEKIEAYEFAYEAYITATRMMLEEALKIAKSSDKSKLQSCINALNAFDYNSAVDLAMKYFKEDNPNADEYELVKPVVSDEQSAGTVETNNNLSVCEKMDVLYSLLGNKYCTVNQKACRTSWNGGHGCTNCNMRDIAQATWFKNIFGTINVNNFPEHDVDASRRDHTGQSCFGFACFAQWYVYADSASEEIKGKRIADVEFNKANMEKYVQPGDVVRVNGHSVLVYSIEENGLMVLDCNWNSGGQLNCMVQKHLLDYGNSRYAGYTAYINRVTKAADMEDGQAGKYLGMTTVKSEETSNLQKPTVADKTYGMLDLSATNWSGYNVGLDKDMYADKAYTIRHGAKLEILGKYTNAKGNQVYHVYSFDLGRECYISAKYVKIEEDKIETESYGYLELPSTWKAYNVGTTVDMYADKAYTIYPGAKLKILGEYTNSKGNKIYQVYSYDLEMNCYIAAKYVKIE